MLRHKIEAIARELECQYDYSEELIKIIGWGDIPISYHRFIVEYRSVEIYLTYEFGNSNMGKVRCSFKPKWTATSFTVTTSSQFRRLFSTNKNPFRIRCNDQTIKDKIIHALAESGLLEFGKATAFEPEISGKIENNIYIVDTLFSLAFDDKEKAILPLINFHKYLIDLLGK